MPSANSKEIPLLIELFIQPRGHRHPVHLEPRQFEIVKIAPNGQAPTTEILGSPHRINSSEQRTFAILDKESDSYVSLPNPEGIDVPIIVTVTRITPETAEIIF